MMHTSLILVLLFSMVIFAENAAAKTYYQQQEFNQGWCIKQSTQDCLTGVCIAATPTNCAHQCKTNAVNKCHALTKQQRFSGA